MPRRKTIQPPPLYSFPLENGTIVEVRDETCRIIGRGSHRRDAFLVTRDEILEIVINEYFSPDKTDLKQRRWKLKTNIKDDYLASAAKFAQKMQTLGYGGEDGVDDSALRKSLYPDIMKNFRAYQRALEEIA